MTTPLLARWAVFRSGHGPYDDYRITALAADPADRERFSSSVRFLALAFHSDLEMPPQGKEVFLFWQLAPKEWALALVLDDPDLVGRRRGLEYLVLVLGDDQLKQLGGTPLPAMERGRHWAELRRRGLAGEEVLLPLELTELPQEEASGLVVPLPGELPATAESMERLRHYLLQLAASGRTVSFATWWPSNRTAPRGVFSTLLRAPAQRLPGRGETKERAAQLAAQLLAHLPASAEDEVQGELIHVLRRDADHLAHLVGETMRFGENLETEQWHARNGEGAAIAARLARNIKALVQRGGLPEELEAALAQLDTEAGRLEFTLERLPSPFRPPLLPEEAPSAATEALPISRKLLLFAIGLALFLAGWGLGYLMAPSAAPR